MPRVAQRVGSSPKGLSAYYKTKVDTRSAIAMTDEYPGYRSFQRFTQHSAVNHNVAYAIGDSHTNTIEGLWSLLKRAWYGQHHHYSEKWANYYISETVYKYNNRKNTNAFGDLVRHMVGVAA